MSLWGLRKEPRCRVETPPPPPLPTMCDGEWVAIKTPAEMRCTPNCSTPSKTRSNSFCFFFFQAFNSMTVKWESWHLPLNWRMWRRCYVRMCFKQWNPLGRKYYMDANQAGACLHSIVWQTSAEDLCKAPYTRHSPLGSRTWEPLSLAICIPGN